MMKLLFAAIALAMLATACSSDGSKGTPTLGPPATAGTILERTPSPTTTLAPVPFDVPANHDYKSGDTITDTSGILLVDPVRLTMQVWTMPAQYTARPISHDGRWVFWAGRNNDGSIGTQRLLDTRNGTSRAIVLGTEPFLAIGVSETGKYFAGYTDTKVALFETATLRPLAIADRPAGLKLAYGEANFSADETLSALSFGTGDQRATVVLGIDGKTQPIAGDGGQVRWSNRGHRLALTSEAFTVVHDLDAGTTWQVPAGGGNTQWSPDDRYLAIANKFDTGGARVFSTSPPFAEVLRTVGKVTCIGDYWNADGSMRYGVQQHVTVPGGEVLPAPPIEADAVTLGSDPPFATVLKDGNIVMKFTFGPGIFWSVSYDDEGLHANTSDGRFLALLGIGGKGLCGEGQLPPPAVQLPPFGP